MNCPIRHIDHVLFDPRSSSGSRPKGCHLTKYATLSPRPRVSGTASSCASSGRPEHGFPRRFALRPMDVQRDSLVLPNRKNPNQTVKRVFLPGAELGLTGELLLWAKEQGLADDQPLFFSRKRDLDGSRRPLQRGQSWVIVKQASERAAVHVLALRTSKHGPAGAPAPVHPHLFRHARVRQIVRQTKSLPLAQRQAGWTRLQPVYLSIGDVEAREMMRGLTD